MSHKKRDFRNVKNAYNNNGILTRRALFASSSCLADRGAWSTCLALSESAVRGAARRWALLSRAAQRAASGDRASRRRRRPSSTSRQRDATRSLRALMAAPLTASACVRSSRHRSDKMSSNAA